LTPVIVNKTTIYFISHPLAPPVDALDTILPELDLSSFLAAIFSTSLADILRKQPRTSILVPHNDAFKRLGMLVSDYLLSSSSKPELEHLILHHVIDSVEYRDALVNGSQRTFPTLEGSDVQLHRHPSNGTMTLAPSGGWAHMLSALTPTERLTQTGVVHELSDILLPRSVDITLGKLAKSAKGSTMIGLVTKAGLDWMLNGTAPPEGSPWAEAHLPVDGWTLLCPTDDAFRSYNLTSLYADIPALTVLVSQHIVWSTSSSKSASHLIVDALNNNRPLSLDSQQSYQTILSQRHEYGDIVFRPSNTPSELGSYVVGIKGARGTSGDNDWAQVLAWGRATTGGGKGGVVQIDRVLTPYYPPWWLKYGAPVLVGILGGVGICLFFVGVRWVWRKDMREATYEPVGGFSREEIEE
jgi:solute carrier family 25 (mitochondrial carnitine/acylcarnitine transporter), member 20/29